MPALTGTVAVCDGCRARGAGVESLVEEAVKIGEGVERRSEGERHWRCVRGSRDGLCVFEVQIGRCWDGRVEREGFYAWPSWRCLSLVKVRERVGFAFEMSRRIDQSFGITKVRLSGIIAKSRN